MRRQRSTVGSTAAAEILSMSRQLLADRVHRGKIRPWSRSPMRFRLVDLLAIREAQAFRDSRGSHPRVKHTAPLELEVLS